MNKNALRALIGTALSNGGRALSAPEAQWLCDAYWIPTPKQGFAKTATEAVKIATRLRFPVALKIVSSDILHKTEAGVVIIGLATAGEVRRAFGSYTSSTSPPSSNTVEVVGMRRSRRTSGRGALFC